MVMDVQGYMTPFGVEDARALHYAPPDLVSTRCSSTSLSRSTSALSDYSTTASAQMAPSTFASSRPLAVNTASTPSPVFPAFSAYLAKRRKSSPAVLGLPLGLSDEHQTQLRQHLSKQRNSIEAAMLLATFNRQASDNRLTPVAEKDPHWSDEEDEVASEASLPNHGARRYSHDVSMRWETMPPLFVERSKFNPSSSSSSSSSSSASSLAGHQRHPAPGPGFKAPWATDYDPMATEFGSPLHPHALPHHRPPTTLLPGPPPPMQHPGSSFPGYPSVNHYGPHHQVIHPLAAPSEASPHRGPQGEYHPYFPYGSAPPPHPMAQVPPQQQQQQQQQQPQQQQLQQQQQHPYYHPHPDKLPIPAHMDNHVVNNMSHPAHPYSHLPGPPIKPAKRKKTRADEEEEMAAGIEPGHPEFPDMSLKDIEAARTDAEARPRRQKLRYEGDQYTPQWVRYNGQAKEGLCDTCRPGKWLQLKNSAFWYHKQFFHGISSVSGKEFMQPLETRWVDQDLVEGLCHQCHHWVSVSNVKRKNSVLWYRHAHKCHVYHKPKATTPKQR